MTSRSRNQAEAKISRKSEFQTPGKKNLDVEFCFLQNFENKSWPGSGVCGFSTLFVSIFGFSGKKSYLKKQFIMEQRVFSCSLCQTWPHIRPSALDYSHSLKTISPRKKNRILEIGHFSRSLQKLGVFLTRLPVNFVSGGRRTGDFEFIGLDSGHCGVPT